MHSLDGKKQLEKTLEISDNQEGISTLNGLIDDVSDNNISNSLIIHEQISE
jgi:hypothetical protein